MNFHAVNDGISSTQVVPVSVEESNQKNLFQTSKRPSSTQVTVLRYPGFYVFGGLTDQGLCNRLTVIEAVYEGVRFTEPKTKGQPPQPRYLHSSHYLTTKKIFVVVGGRLNFGDSLERQLDLYALELIEMNWTKIETRKNALPTLCSHSSANDEERIYIFGGVNHANYRDNDLLVLEIKDFNSAVDFSPQTRKNIDSIGQQAGFKDSVRLLI